MNSSRIYEYKTRDTAEALTDMLQRVQHGQHIKGLVFMYTSGPKRHRIGITGDYWDDPAQALACAARLTHRLNEVITAREAPRDDVWKPTKT